MNRELADAIVGFLAAPSAARAKMLSRSSPRRWRASLHWLVTSGLALYLFDELKRSGQLDVLPKETRATLEQMWSASAARVRSLETTLLDLNRRFTATGLPYANWKGFATVPDFCPDARFRAFADFDFFVPPEHQSAFEGVLCDLGYRAAGRLEFEVQFENLPGTHIPFERTYHDSPRRKVELHTRMNGMVGYRNFPIDTGLLARRVVTVRHGAPFPMLAPADAFFLHALHACRHLLEGWTRLAWLLELRRFVEAHRTDQKLWDDVRARAEAMPDGSVMVGVAVWLASSLFEFDMAECLGWATQSVERRVVAWLERFGRAAALAEFPGTKLPLLLVRELIDETSWSTFENAKLAPIKRPPRLSRPEDPSLRQRATAAAWQVKFVWTRLRFHAREGVRYAVEKRRWERTLSALPQQTSLMS